MAPAGAPIRLADLGRWMSRSVSREDASAALRQAVRERFDVRHVALTSTGRAGMTLLLKAMRRLAPAHRDEVVLPSYTCYSVAASVVKAGLKVRVVDISADTLDYSPDALSRTEFGRVLAVVATNLYGLPNNLPKLSGLAGEHGAFLIDDAAQAMGALVGGRPSGTWGDAGLYSLDKGKNVSAIDGGVVVTNSEAIAEALSQEMAQLRAPGVAESGLGVVKALIYFAMLRPWLYGIPNRIPQLELGTTVFTTDFPLETPSRPLVALAATMVSRLDEFTRARRQNATALLAGLTGSAGIRTITPSAGSIPVYLRLPLLAADAGSRDSVLARLRAAGIGATGSYPGAITDIPDLQGSLTGDVDAPGGRHVARHILTLPTHAFVAASDIARTLAAIRPD